MSVPYAPRSRSIVTEKTSAHTQLMPKPLVDEAISFSRCSVAVALVALLNLGVQADNLTSACSPFSPKPADQPSGARSNRDSSASRSSRNEVGRSTRL